MQHAVYQVVFEQSDRDRLVIRDVGHDCGRMSVTNDAEHVLAELFAEGLLRDRQRLWYYDSDGRLDEILHRGGRFAGFAPGHRVEVLP